MKWHFFIFITNRSTQVFTDRSQKPAVSAAGHQGGQKSSIRCVEYKDTQEGTSILVRPQAA